MKTSHRLAYSVTSLVWAALFLGGCATAPPLKLSQDYQVPAGFELVTETSTHGGAIFGSEQYVTYRNDRDVEILIGLVDSQPVKNYAVPQSGKDILSQIKKKFPAETQLEAKLVNSGGKYWLGYKFAGTQNGVPYYHVIIVSTLGGYLTTVQVCAAREHSIELNKAVIDFMDLNPRPD